MNAQLSVRMRTYYWLIVALIVVFASGTVGVVLLGLEALGLMRHLSIMMLISLLAVSGVASGMLSYFVGRRIITPMLTLSRASNEVAQGNFNIQIKDSSKLEEVQTTFRNFNHMVQTLNSTATLSNDFIANVSHEFKTPLTAIEGYAMLLQDSTLSEAERSVYLEDILKSTHRLSTLVGNILLLSKLESQALAEQYTSFRLDEQLRQAVVMLEPEWAARSISFDAALSPLDFYGCESLLAQVWTNLLSNAIKFSQPGQEIRIALLEQTECVQVTITDQGCGMTPEVKERIFEKFYQGDPSHRAQGNGLGLALVHRIVELCGGIIEVDSLLGHGSTFRVILPKKKAPAQDTTRIL